MESGWVRLPERFLSVIAGKGSVTWSPRARHSPLGRAVTQCMVHCRAQNSRKAQRLRKGRGKRLGLTAGVCPQVKKPG